MHYEALNDSFDFLSEENILYKLLNNRDVPDPKTFLNLDESVLHDGMLLENMLEGLEMLHEHVQKKNRIHVQVDADNDGNCSSAIIIKYIKKLDPKARISYTLHTGKEHGIVLKLIDEIKFDLLIIPDAGTNDVEQCKVLNKRGKDILILDHHDIEKKNSRCATVINCKDGKYPNPTLAGSTVVYKFCKEYDKKYKRNFADDFLDLASWGTIADAMDLKNYETRYMVLKGLEKMLVGNSFLQALIKKQEYQIKDKINIKKVGWYISPLINGCIRVGSAEDKLNMFRALLEEEKEIEYTPRKSKNNPEPVAVQLTLQEHMANEVVKIKAKQDREVKKGVEELNERIIEKKLDENKIIMVDASGILDKNYTGLVANKLANQYKRPTLLLKKFRDNVYGGSGRNYSLSSVVDFRELLQKLGTFNWVMGHQNAFGFNINTDNLVPTRDKANDILKDMEITDTYHVDYEIPMNKLKPKHIKEVADWTDLWGGGLEEPLFAITNIYIPTDNIQLIGGKGNMIKFESHDITFIKKFSNEEEYNRMIFKQNKGLSKKKVRSVKIDAVVKFVRNEWENRISYQCEIIDWNSVDSKNFIF